NGIAILGRGGGYKYAVVKYQGHHRIARSETRTLVRKGEEGCMAVTNQREKPIEAHDVTRPGVMRNFPMKLCDEAVHRRRVSLVMERRMPRLHRAIERVEVRRPGCAVHGWRIAVIGDRGPAAKKCQCEKKQAQSHEVASQSAPD